MLVKVFGAAVQGIDAFVVTIEVNASRGIRFFLVGLPDSAVRESHERIVSALQCLDMKFPAQQIIVNMSPADIRKEGAAYDLPLAIGILAAGEILGTGHLEEYLIMGELSLDGTLLPVKGVLSMALKAKESGFKGMILPIGNAPEAAAVGGLEIIGADNLKQVIGFLNGTVRMEPFNGEQGMNASAAAPSLPDYADVKGQMAVIRAMEVAAAGSHNIIMSGPPGSGKSMIAQRMPSILPPLSLEESLETTRIHSVAGLSKSGGSLMTERPFRSPHHTISGVALTGGGTNAQPGEISLAHNGVLYLDELPEFSRTVLEMLRQPLEDRRITVSRSKYCVEYPASFMLVASMNPCPCGYCNHPTRPCTCRPDMISRYRNRISGPLMDRFDIQCEILPVPFEVMSRDSRTESSSSIRSRVETARAIQADRFRNEKGIYSNSQMTQSMVSRYALPDREGLLLLRDAMIRLDLSARAYNRILKVARTIADIEGNDMVQSHHIAEAIGYRSLDRADWRR